MLYSGRKTYLKWVLVIPIVVIFFVSLYLSLLLRYGTDFSKVGTFGEHARAFLPLLPVWMVVLFTHNLFELSSFRRYVSLIVGLLSAMAVNLVLGIIFFYVQPDLIITPRRVLFLHVGISYGMLLCWYLIIKHFFKEWFTEGIYLFQGPVLDMIERDVSRNAFLGYEVLGRLDKNSSGDFNVKRNSGVVFSDFSSGFGELLPRLYKLRSRGVVFYNDRDFYERLLRKVYLSELSEVWFLENVSYRDRRLYGMTKRLCDLIFGLIGLFVFAVTFPFIAFLIKITSPGPVLFVQPRVGQGGKVFNVYKYRTMKLGVNNTWTSKNDPRITWFGNFLRKSRMDELPQCLNLILGNMSLVGPRPEQVHIVENLKKEIPFFDERHVVKPGITGWAQLNVYAATVEETKSKLQYDLYYVKNRSLLLDLEIILKTAYYIFTWSGR